MLPCLHANADHTDSCGWEIRPHRHTSRTPGGVPTQRLHADERCGHGPTRPHRASGRRSSARVGVLRHFHSNTGADSHSCLDRASSSGASRRPRCCQVPDGGLVRSLRSASQSQHIEHVGTSCKNSDGQDRCRNEHGPHDVCEGVKGFGPAFPPLFVAAHADDTTRRTA